MSIDQSIELAAWLAIHSHEFVRLRGSVSETGLREYWTLSRRRLDRWCRLLREAAAERGSFGGPDVWWQRTRPVLEEVFTTEILTRVWTALTSGIDRASGRGRLLSVATNIQLGHSDARNRALHVLFDAWREFDDRAAGVNRLRVRAERWTDLLLANLAPECETRDLAFDRDRVQQFAADAAGQRQAGVAAPTWPLLKMALRGAFAGVERETWPHAAWNARIACGVFTCCQAELLDLPRMPSQFWLERLEFAIAHLEGWVDQLLEDDSSSDAADRHLQTG